MYQSFIIMLSPSNVVFLLFKRYSMPSPSDPPPTREEEKLAARLSLILELARDSDIDLLAEQPPHRRLSHSSSDGLSLLRPLPTVSLEEGWLHWCLSPFHDPSRKVFPFFSVRNRLWSMWFSLVHCLCKMQPDTVLEALRSWFPLLLVLSLIVQNV